MHQKRNRVEGYNRREQRRSRLSPLDQVAGIDPAIRHAAGNGGPHLRPVEIKLGVAQRCLGGKLLRFRDFEIGLPLIDLARSDGAALSELQGPAGVEQITDDPLGFVLAF